MKSRAFPITLLALSLCRAGLGQEWISLFDGQTMNGWRPSEHKDTWTVEDGALVSHGARSHLFYEGAVRHHDFKNFELKAEVKTRPGSNSGIYIHTHYQESDWPATGYECQVINSNTNNQPGSYVERKMTASIYAIRNLWKAPAPDNEWFRYHIIVQGKTIRTYINDELMADYTEPENPFRPSDKKGRLLSSGTFALQGHDAGSVVAFRHIEVKPLPDDLPSLGTPMDDPSFDAKIVQLADDNFPLIDLDVRLDGGLTLGQALANSRKYGYTYGFVFDGEPPAGFRRPPQAFVGMRIAGAASPAAPRNPSRAKVDYVIADMGAETDTSTRINDPQRFMDQTVERIEQLARSQHIDICAGLTALPNALKADYEALWSPERMDRVIKALKSGNIAVEINDRLQVPSAAFINRAKAAGIRFAFGSDNTSAGDLGRLAYCVAMVEQCQLTPKNLWWPDPRLP